MAKNCENELSAIWPDDVYVVCGTGERIQPGDMSVVIDEFAGWKGRLSRNGLMQMNSDPGDGDTYFNYTSITGEYTFSQQATDGEKFIMMAGKPA